MALASQTAALHPTKHSTEAKTAHHALRIVWPAVMGIRQTAVLATLMPLSPSMDLAGSMAVHYHKLQISTISVSSATSHAGFAMQRTTDSNALDARWAGGSAQIESVRWNVLPVSTTPKQRTPAIDVIAAVVIVLQGWRQTASLAPPASIWISQVSVQTAVLLELSWRADSSACLAMHPVSRARGASTPSV